MSGFEDKLNAILGDREAMGQIMALAQSLGKGDDGPGSPSGEEEDGFVPVADERRAAAAPGPDLGSMLGEIDPRMMEMGLRLMREYNRADNKNAALLQALRPFVKEERFEKVDRAVRIARLSRVVRVLFDTMKQGGGGGFV